MVRTANTDHHEVRVEGALFHGAVAVTGNTFLNFSREASDRTTAVQAAQTTAEATLRQITHNDTLRETFYDYYGGLRWGTDQEKFVNQLFEQAAELDNTILENLSSTDLTHLAYELDVPYETRREWDTKQPAEIFEQIPEMDYRQLADPAFAETPAGQQLAAAYKKFCGYKVARDYRQYPRPLTDQGEEIPKPRVPLSRFPLIEALVADEVSTIGPKAKYNMGPSEVVSLVLDSDSVSAQQALVVTLTTRLPHERRRVFDGPDELEHKRRAIGQLTRAYRDAQDPEWRETHGQQLLEVFDAYISDGVMVADIRDEHQQLVTSGYTGNNAIYQTKNIIKDILTAGLASPDAADFIVRYLPEMQWEAEADSDNRELPAIREVQIAPQAEQDPLELTQAELIMVVLDAADRTEPGFRPAVFERFCRHVFGDVASARSLREVTELRAQAAELRRTPAVLLAAKGLDAVRLIFDNDNPKKTQARAAFEAAIEPAEIQYEAATTAKNTLMLEYLARLVAAGPIAERGTVNSEIFRGIVDRLSFGSASGMRALPSAYSEIMALAEHPHVGTGLKSHVLWRVAEAFKYCDRKAAQLLSDVVLDGYRLMLGEPGALRMPAEETDHGLAALNYLAHNNPFFKYAREDQILELSNYLVQMKGLTEMVATSAILGKAGRAHRGKPFEEWTATALKNCEDVVRSMTELATQYQDYLHLEEVKVKPSVYYPWLMKQLAPFWQKMQWEVRPDNRPSAGMVGLHQVLRYHIAHRLVLDDEALPEEFDVFDQGHLDTLLLECHERMVAATELQYNQAVWVEGLSFMHYATNFMPPVVVEQFRAKHPHHTAFLKYLDARRQTEEE